MKRSIAILGSTGSIGAQALQIIDMHPDMFEVAALTAHSNAAAFLSQVKKYRPRFAGMVDEEAAKAIRGQIPEGVFFSQGGGCLKEACALPGLDLALIAVVGMAGLKPLIECIERGVQVALANKEALVCGGTLVVEKLKKKGQFILPVDSEHSAIFQCLQAKGEGNSIKRIFLTCSGGAFRDWKKKDLFHATPAQALKNPNWDMGKKVTIDSATLMNKGLETIEAHALFGVPADDIEVIIHRQSIIHSMVEFEDSSVIAQLALPDMRIPIQYALYYPKRVYCGVQPLDLIHLEPLTFEKPDTSRFPCLLLACEALKRGRSAPIALNAANEIAVGLFLDGRIGFMDIPEYIEAAMDKFGGQEVHDVDDIITIDADCREYIFSGFK
ncbi:MAG: 1-deoxy-D-xylulose-5-phosphate reductoisomerase [Bacillota bacterium]|nr:1-deoxy-D-xylulose-5-phosphate reductoisomerase [Bacillota bacterium]